MYIYIYIYLYIYIYIYIYIHIFIYIYVCVCVRVCVCVCVCVCRYGVCILCIVCFGFCVGLFSVNLICSDFDLVLTDKVPNHHLHYAIFTCLYCFWPVGLAAVITSLKSRSASRERSMERARQLSGLAKILAHVALALGLPYILGIMLLYFILFEMPTHGLIVEDNWNDTYYNRNYTHESTRNFTFS